MRRILIAIVFIIGVLALVVGIVYISQKASSLPSFFPGHSATLHRAHKSRGYAGVALGAVLIIISLIAAYMTAGRRRRHY